MRAFVPALLATVTYAASGTFDYKLNGADWGETSPLCGQGKEQSPVDLNDGAESNSAMEINGYGYQNYSEGKFITHKGSTL